jgi:biopolymer transport protein ExbD
MSSRTFVALNTPISLAHGSIKSGPFKINLRNYYTVKIDTGWESYFDPNCPSYDNVRARWMLYRDGAVVVKWIDASSPYTYLGDFLGDEGTYELHLDILSDTACLNPGHPRLLVYTDRGEYDDRASPVLWASAVGVPLGASLVILAVISAKSSNWNVRISDSQSIAQCFQWAQKLPLKRQFESPPAFALLAAPVLVILTILFMVLLQPYPSKGLHVHLLKQAHSAGEADPLAEPVIACVADAGLAVTPPVYVNATATSWGELESALRDQLKLRPKWVVHVEAEPNVSWAYAATVVDIAKGLHASVVLVDMESPKCGHSTRSRDERVRFGPSKTRGR